MTVTYTAFYADPPEGPSRWSQYSEYAFGGRRAMELTNPSGRYVVLTDRRTAKRIENDIEVQVVCEDDVPLMVKAVQAELGYVQRTLASLSILADTDCIANRRLDDAMPPQAGLGITYRKDLRINNVAFVRDHDLAAWFLAKALALVSGYSAERQDWFGDQESWEEALGTWPQVEDRGIASPAGRVIHMLPCVTHNCAPCKDGRLKRGQEDAFLLHFKGVRKPHLRKYVDDVLERRFAGALQHAL